MRHYLLIALLLLSTACTPPTAQDESMQVQSTKTPPAATVAPAAPAAEFASRYTHLPAEAADVLARIDECLYFSGEFNGDGSARDKEVSARMDALGCAGVIEQIPAMLQKYAATHPDVITALKAVFSND